MVEFDSYKMDGRFFEVMSGPSAVLISSSNKIFCRPEEIKIRHNMNFFIITHKVEEEEEEEEMNNKIWKIRKRKKLRSRKVKSENKKKEEKIMTEKLKGRKKKRIKKRAENRKKKRKNKGNG